VERTVTGIFLQYETPPFCVVGSLVYTTLACSKRCHRKLETGPGFDPWRGSHCTPCSSIGQGALLSLSGVRNPAFVVGGHRSSGDAQNRPPPSDKNENEEGPVDSVRSRTFFAYRAFVATTVAVSSTTFISYRRNTSPDRIPSPVGCGCLSFDINCAICKSTSWPWSSPGRSKNFVRWWRIFLPRRRNCTFCCSSFSSASRGNPTGGRGFGAAPCRASGAVRFGPRTESRRCSDRRRRAV